MKQAALQETGQRAGDWKEVTKYRLERERLPMDIPESVSEGNASAGNEGVAGTSFFGCWGWGKKDVKTWEVASDTFLSFSVSFPQGSLMILENEA